MPTAEEEVIETTLPESEEVETTEEETTEAEIQIGDKSFKTEAEALVFAREQMTLLEVESAKADAYRQGILDRGTNVTNQPNVTPPNPQDDKDWDVKFYENPRKALAEAQAAAVIEAEKRILGRVTQQSEDVRLWNKFCEQNPDLADFKRDVESMGDEHKEIVTTIAKTKGEDAAMQFLATKTRTKFQQYAEKAKPSRELPNKGGGASPTGGGGGGAKDVTGSKDKKDGGKPLSFIDQIKQNKRRHA